jgi:hypothetical protein
MTTYNITVGGGITIGGGILVNISGFTLSGTDFSSLSGATGVTVNGTTGFTTAASGNPNNIVDYVFNASGPQGDTETRIVDAFAAAGMDTAYAYAWNVTWGPASNPSSGIVRMSWNGTSLQMSPIDTSDTGWQSGGVGGPALYGTFNFPATFTPYSPLTQLSTNGNWC